MRQETCGSFSKIGEIIASLYVNMGNPLERKKKFIMRERKGTVTGTHPSGKGRSGRTERPALASTSPLTVGKAV